MYFSSIRATLRVVSRRPNRLTKTGAPAPWSSSAGELADLQPSSYGTGGVRTDRRKPLAATLAPDPKHARRQIDVAVVEPDQFAHPQAGRIERLQDGPVAQAELLRRMAAR